MMLEGTWKAVVRAEGCSAHCSLDFLAQKPMEHSSAKCLCMVPSIGPGELSGGFSPWTPVADSCYPGCPLGWQIIVPSADGSLPGGQGCWGWWAGSGLLGQLLQLGLWLLKAESIRQDSVKASRFLTVDFSLVSDACVHTESFPSCLTLCDRMVCSPPDSSTHGILQASVLEWVAMPSSRGSPRHRDGTHVSCSSCIAGGFFTVWATRKTFASDLGPQMSLGHRPPPLVPSAGTHTQPGVACVSGMWVWNTL